MVTPPAPPRDDGNGFHEPTRQPNLGRPTADAPSVPARRSAPRQPVPHHQAYGHQPLLLRTPTRDGPGQLALRFVAGVRRRYLHLAIAGFFLLAALLLALTDGGALPIMVNLYIAAFHGLCAGVMPRFGTVVTNTGITVRGFSTRQFSWSEVKAIEAVTFLGARRTQIRLTKGSKVRSWAPYDDFILTDLKFDHKLEALQHWHAQHATGPMVHATLTTAELPIIDTEPSPRP